MTWIAFEVCRITVGIDSDCSGVSVVFPVDGMWSSRPLRAVAVPTLAQVERSGRRDEKLEFEVYPAFRSGYLALGGGFAPDALLYPRSTLSAELYKTLPADFEISGGYRRLNFTDKSVDVATGSLGKYVSSYFVGGRVNHFPSYGTSVTGLVRRYLSDDGQYISVFGSTGSVPELIREPGSVGLGVRF